MFFEVSVRFFSFGLSLSLSLDRSCAQRDEREKKQNGVRFAGDRGFSDPRALCSFWLPTNAANKPLRPSCTALPRRCTKRLLVEGALSARAPLHADADADADEEEKKRRQTKTKQKNSPVERVVVLVLSIRVVERVAVGPVIEWIGERKQDKRRGG